MTQKFIDVPHIGEVLQEEFLEPLGLSQNALANAINVPPNRINAIIRGLRSVTADTDLRLNYLRLNNKLIYLTLFHSTTRRNKLCNIL